MPRSRPLIDRFAEKVALDGAGCLLWLGATKPSADGRLYPVIHYEGRPIGAHIASWFLAYGWWPAPGMDIDHLCRVSLCVHPDHIEEVTHAENLRRGRHAPQRADPTKCKAGLHDWTPENTRYPGRCYPCLLARNKEWKRRNR